MIRENQRLLNYINVISDGLIIFLSLPIAYWFRFYVLPNGIENIPFRNYLILSGFIAVGVLITFACFGLYTSFRRTTLRKELVRLCLVCLLDIGILLSLLFIGREEHYSRITLGIFFVVSVLVLSAKRVILRLTLRHLRAKGYNKKYVVVLGNGTAAKRYLYMIQSQPHLGYHSIGYVSDEPMDQDHGLPHLGSFDELHEILEKFHPDEVISAVEISDYHRTPEIIDACEQSGIKLSIIPPYSDYMSSPQFDSIGNIPLLNIRRIPLDNWGNAVCKRLMDIIGSLILLIITSPVMLICTIGVKLSSPGPVIFKQERIGLNKDPFFMYKFRSMRVNTEQDTGWSTNQDSRKTKFGAFIRKYSLDEFPQFFNVLKGDMSLVGPRPELPHFVDQFKDEIPLYMVKHQVRPGITGWAQVNDFRGDTSIKARVEHDIYYIERWSLLFDIKILLMTIFKGKFKNSEQLK